MGRIKIDYGIDLGTTNSAIARMVKGEPKIIKSDMLKDTMPSCVHYNKRQDCLVGDGAMNVLKNDHARTMKGFKKGGTNTYIEFKRTMGKDTKYQCGNLNRELTSEELSAEVLKRLKSFVLDENILSIVVTVPAKFTVPQIDATIKAANKAGFKQVITLQEPIAAVTAYGLGSGKKDGYWLVFDFGGGTFDAALIKAEEGVMQVKDTDGDNFLGGKNLDEAIIDQIILPYLQDTYAIDSILNDPEKREILRKGVKYLAEEAKTQMSFKDTTTILSNLGDIPFEDEFGEEIEIEIPVTLKDMERVLGPIFQKAIDITKELLSRNNLNKDKLDALILVGGPTHSSILRRMLKEQITENVDTSVDPMTVVAQGAALFASTVDIEMPDGETTQDTSTDSEKIDLDLKYPAQSVETNEMVSIKVLKDKSGNFPDETFVELKRADGAWSLIKQVNDKKATIFDVDLVENKANFFEIYVTDAEANLLKCEKEGFTILQGIINPEATLPYHIGIAKYFEDKEKDLFYPVKGLEKNKAISTKDGIEGTIKGLKTRSIIEKGNANHKLRIPIYQGDYAAIGTELSLNNLVYEVIITGDKLPGTLLEGSTVDITIKVDESQQMLFNAYFPHLNYSEELEIEIQQEKVRSEASIAKDIANAKQKAQKANRNDVARELDELDEQLKRGAGSDDNKLEIQKGIRDALLKLPSEKEDWESVENELNESYDQLEGLVDAIENGGGGGNLNVANVKAQFEDIRRKKQQIIAEKNIREAKKLIEEIGALQFNLANAATGGLMDFQYLQNMNDNFNSIKWTNPALARQLIAQGMGLANAGQFNAIRPILIQLVQLMERGGNTPTGLEDLLK